MAHPLSTYEHLVDDESRGRLHVEFEPGQEIRELRWVLDRAMNCMAPKDMPAWLVELSAKVDERFGDVKPMMVRPVTRETVPKHPDCKDTCQQAEEYGVPGERHCDPDCIWLKRNVPVLPVDGMRAPEPNDLIGGATDQPSAFPMLTDKDIDAITEEFLKP